MEKEPKLYNQAGQVEDPEIARKMAEHEDWARKNYEKLGEKITNDKQKDIDEATEMTGKDAHYELMIGRIVDKIRGILTPEEIVEFLKYEDEVGREPLIRKLLEKK